MYNYARGATRQPPARGASRFLTPLPVHALKHPGGVASMTRDRGYPDWLVLSARLLRSGYHSAKIYIFWSCLACGYVKILQPVAMCSYFRNTCITRDS